MNYAFPFLFLFTIIKAQSNSFQLWIVNQDIVNREQQATIYKDGILSQYFSGQIFDDTLNCKNGNLEIINNTNGDKLLLQYANQLLIDKNSINISVQPNEEPKPYANVINESHIEILFNCVCDGREAQCNKDNYYNKVNVNIDQYSFSFLLNCDPNTRHKNFQIGYILISLISSFIIVGVAMHSHIWSIKINLRPLRLELSWKIFLVICLIFIAAILLVFFLLRSHEFTDIFKVIRYFGIIYASFFVFICLNESFYLIKALKKTLFKIIRRCDILSFIFTIALTIIGFFIQNWIYYNFLAGCICVGSIKLFHFKSLKQAISAMVIMVASLFVLTTIMHFTLPRSYNDYAGELSTPFFLQVPDLVNNIYKKCSWLSNTDVVIPGVMLSYLRLYDQNKGSKYGGVYTVSGNLAFAISTIIWISIQLIYPFSVPFSLITNSLLILVIFIISYRRQQWKTLFYGSFNQGNDTINQQSLQQNRKSFSHHISEDLMKETLIKQEANSLILNN